jgi:benzoate transport
LTPSGSEPGFAPAARAGGSRTTARIATTEPDPRELIADRPMAGLQIGIIAVLCCLNGLDGFDVLTISFAAPGIVRAWAISPDVLGLVISTGLAATGFGSLVLAPVADRLGRRPMIAVSLVSMTMGMLVCALAPTTLVLCAGRLLTGLGVGAVVPCLSALAAEYANHRFRDLAVVIVATGFPAGGLLGGGLSAALLERFDWRSVFVAGALTTGILALISVWYLPESVEYLIARRPVDAQARINTILARLRRPTVKTLPEPGAAKTGTSLLDIVLRPELLGIALFVTAIYALHNATVYYALNWIPKIVADLSLSQSQAATVGAWCSGGGILGALVAAWMSTRFDIKPLTGGCLLGAAVLLWIFVNTPGQMTLLMTASGVLGACLYGGQTSLYALMTRSFPIHVRATGIGFVTGVGRVGGILAPIVSGHLLGKGLGYAQVSTLMALGSLVGGIALFMPVRWGRSSASPPARPT